MTPGNDSGYLEASDLELQVSRLLALANPNGGAGNGQLVVQRTGVVCNTDFPGFTGHSALVNFTLNFNGVVITTTSLPDAIVRAYVTQLLSIGGTAPLTWSASGLPSGLAIDAQTGLISGTPTAPATATVVVTVQGADGSRAQSSLTLQVATRVTRWGILIGYSCQGPANLSGGGFTGFPATEDGDQLSFGFSVATIQRGGLSCPDSHDAFTGTLTAVEQKDASGDIVALTNVVFTITRDATAQGGPVCVDTPVVIPGPIAASGNRFVKVIDEFDVSRCFFGTYQTLQIFKLS